MPANIPQIGVRLSADGVQDVINAFARVRKEAKQTGSESAGAFNLLTSSLGSLTSLLPTLTAAAAVTGLISLGTNALGTVESLEKLAQKTGTSVGMLSVFALAAKETGTDTDVLNIALAKLAKGSQDAADGSAKQAKGFKDLGISIADINTKNPGQLFVEIAQKLQGIESPGLRAQAAVALFGRAGVQLIPLLNKIGTEGFDSLEEKAKRFGVYIGGDFAENAKAAQSGLADVKAEIEGAALQFTSGLLPAVTGVANAFADLAGGASGFESFGQIVGTAVLGMANDLVYLDKWLTIGFAKFDEFANKGRTLQDTIDSTIGFTAAQRATAAQGLALDKAAEAEDKNTINQAKIDFATAMADLDKAYAALHSPKAGGDGPASSTGAPGTGVNPEDVQKEAEARSKYLQAQADNELAILKTRNQLAEDADKRSYDAGLLSLQDYYDARRDRINEEADAELAILNKKLAAAQNQPAVTAKGQVNYPRLEEIGKINTQISEVGLHRTGSLDQADSDQASALRQKQLQQLEITKQLEEAQGNAAAANRTNLDIEIEKYEQLLKTQGKSVEEIGELSDAARTKGAAKIDFSENMQTVEASLASMDQQIQAINDAVANGSITEIQGQTQVRDLEEKRLAGLQDIVDLMKQQVALSGDPQQLASLNALIANLNHVKSTFKEVTTAQTYLTNQLATTGRGDLEDFFAAGISGSKSFSDALKDLADDFEQIIARMVAKLLIFYALEAIVGFVAPGSDFASNLAAAGPFGKYDDGGWTGGKAGQVAGVVHGEEFVVKAGPAAAYLPLLQAINQGKTPVIATPASVSTSSANYTAAAAVAGGDGGGAPIVQVINNTGQQTQQKQSTGSGGQSITQIIVGAVAASIANGTEVAKAMQTNFGLARAGVRRA